MEAFWGILIPFLGMTLGAACVLFMEKSLGDSIQRALTGFAADVMVAASVWSLLIPAIEQGESTGVPSFLPVFIGFWLGVLFLLTPDHLIPHFHAMSEQECVVHHVDRAWDAVDRAGISNYNITYTPNSMEV